MTYLLVFADINMNDELKREIKKINEVRNTNDSLYSVCFEGK